MDTPAERPFWETTRLEDMTRAQWESLCDGCGRCCLHKLRDYDTDELAFTDVACHMLDGTTCLCRDYTNRRRHVPDCVQLTPELLRQVDWLPPSCGYRRVKEGRGLAWWHPLRSGTPDTVHQSGASVRGRTISEHRAGDLEDHVVDWPATPPRFDAEPGPG